jgi:hypothetical protein
MRIDLSSSIVFGDPVGLRAFLMDHVFVHEQESQALQALTGETFSTIGLLSQQADDAWVGLMERRQRPTPQPLTDWLQLHALMHDQIYEAIAGEGTVAPDLSVVDFSQEAQFYDWMFAHQSMHDYEQGILGLS